MRVIVALLSLAAASLAMFPEEAGLHDWRRSFVGAPSFVAVTDSAVVVATTEGVVAALEPSTGDLRWRQLALPEGQPLRALVVGVAGETAVTVGGAHGEYVQAWDVATGLARWQHGGSPAAASPAVAPAAGAFSVHADRTTLTIVSGAAITRLALATGAVTAVTAAAAGNQWLASTSTFAVAADSASGAISAVVSASGTATPLATVPAGSDCRALASSHVVCASSTAAGLFVVAADAAAVAATPLAVAGAGPWRFAAVADPFASAAALVLVNGDGSAAVAITADAAGVVSARPLPTAATPASYALTAPAALLVLPATAPPTLYALPTLASTTAAVAALPALTANVVAVAAGTAANSKLTVAVLASGDVVSSAGWSRPDGLGAVADAVFVDLPAPAAAAEAAEEAAAAPVRFVARLTRHCAELAAAMLGGSNAAATASPSAAASATAGAATRDVYNSRKRIVVATRTGLVVGLDSASGAVAWTVAAAVATSSNGGATAQLFVAQEPAAAGGVVVAVFRRGDAVVAIALEPTSGAVVHPATPWPHPVAALGLAPAAEAMAHLRPLLLVDAAAGRVSVFPPTPAAAAAARAAVVAAAPVTLFAAAAAGSSLRGWRVSVGGAASDTLVAELAWELPLPSSHVLAALAAPADGARAAALGDPLPDRTVMYKYLNPHLRLVAALDAGAARLSLLLVDVVKGRVVHAAVHDDVRGPVRAAMAENWAAVTFWSRRARRAELAVLELVDASGAAPDAPFSALAGSYSPPVVYNRTYVAPDLAAALAVTTTTHGITHRALLLARASGAVTAVPKRAFDARRSYDGTAVLEGLPAYHPLLPAAAPGASVNYNQTVARIAGMRTAGTQLESTCLYFAFGLDLHAGRVHPSKVFDALSPQFSYGALTAGLAGLAVAVAVAARAAGRHTVNLLWA